MQEEFNPSMGNSSTEGPESPQGNKTPDVNTPPSIEDVTNNTSTQGVNPMETQPVQQEQQDVNTQATVQEQNVDQNPDTQNTPRTAAQFYRGIANQVTEDIPQEIRDVSAQKEEQMQEKAKIAEKRLAVNKEQGHTSPFKIRQNLELRKEGKALEKVDEAQRQEIMQTNAQLQNLRSPAEELNANIASDKEVARTIEPRRLEELAKANEPLPGQEAAVRMIDQTPEQRQQRLGKEYGSLPEDQRTEEQKDMDILKRQEEYKRVGVQKLTARLTQEFQSKNQSIESADNRNETYALWNTDPEAIQLFVERAYEEMESEEVLLNGDVERGYWSLRSEAKELEKPYGNTRDEKNQIDYLRSRAEKVEKLQKEAMIPMITWQLQNELAQAMGAEPVTAGEFLAKVDRISENWKDEDKRFGHYMNKARKYRDSLPRETRTNLFGGISGNPEVFSPQGSYFEGILQDIADISGKRADKLSIEDVPTILAYYNVALEEGTHPVDYDNLTMGIEIALQHVIKNPTTENITVNSMPELVRQIRNRNEIKGGYRPDFRDITRAYEHMIFDARAFDIHINFTRRLV
jgi:hypothetical protein